MAEETVVEQQPVAANIPGSVQVITPDASFWNDSSWGSAPFVNQPVAPVVEEKKQDVPDPVKPKEEIASDLSFLEKETGFKSWDDVKNLKSQVEELQKKAQTPAEIKFANEQSQKLFEAWKEGKEDDVYSYLDTKRKLSQAANLPAAEAIKLHLQQTNPHYKPEDVEDVFEERYTLPKKPVLAAGEEQEDFDARMQEYTSRVAKINRAIERDAVSAKQELAKRITELVPPEIPKAQPKTDEPDPKVLEAFDAMRKGYVQKLETEYNLFDGFNTKVKDESVELPIAFKADDKDKAEIRGIIEKAVFTDLDVNDYFTNRWFKKDAAGNLIPDINLMISDFMLLEKRDKVFQAIANNGASSRLAHQIKLNSNINVNGKTQVQPAAPSEMDHMQKQIDHLWKNA